MPRIHCGVSRHRISLVTHPEDWIGRWMNASLTSRLVEVQNIPILLKHVDLLDTGDGLHPELFKRRL